MGASQRSVGRRARLVGAAAAVAGAAGGLLGLAVPAGGQPGCTPVMGRATTTAAQQAAWFASTGHQPKLDVSVLDLATMFVEEGAREGVRGDIAFAQSIVETGYFGFSASVPPALHNYSGIGATGGGVKGATFPDARTGVRAQVQHLRAYADPSLRSAADLKAPLVDPRFGFLVPNSRTVPCWEQFGNGVWAADPTGYGPRVLAVHHRIGAFPRPAAPAPKVEAPALAAPEPAPPGQPAPVVATPLPIEPDAVQSAVATDPELAVRPALTSSSAGGGPAGTAASVLGGSALLTIGITLWWHGRRFLRAG